MQHKKKLDDIIDPITTLNFISSHHLIEAMRNSDRKMDIKEVGVDNITKKIPVNQESNGVNL